MKFDLSDYELQKKIDETIGLIDGLKDGFDNCVFEAFEMPEQRKKMKQLIGDYVRYSHNDSEITNEEAQSMYHDDLSEIQWDKSDHERFFGDNVNNAWED